MCLYKSRWPWLEFIVCRCYSVLKTSVVISVRYSWKDVSIWPFVLQSVELFGKDHEVWPCGRCVNGGRLWLMHSQFILCLLLVGQDVSSQLLIKPPVCQLRFFLLFDKLSYHSNRKVPKTTFNAKSSINAILDIAHHYNLNIKWNMTHGRIKIKLVLMETL